MKVNIVGMKPDNIGKISITDKKTLRLSKEKMINKDKVIKKEDEPIIK